MEDRPEISAAPFTVSSPSPAAVVSSVRDGASSAPSHSHPPAPPPPSFAPSTSAAKHESASMMDVDSNASVEDRTRRATSVLSMDDIEAAQALEGLRSGMCLAAREGIGCSC